MKYYHSSSINVELDNLNMNKNFDLIRPSNEPGTLLDTEAQWCGTTCQNHGKLYTVTKRHLKEN